MSRAPSTLLDLVVQVLAAGSNMPNHSVIDIFLELLRLGNVGRLA